MQERRRFPPPWTIEENNDACFIVGDKNGQALGYFHFEDEPGRRTAAKLLTRDEARRLAANFPSCRSIFIAERNSAVSRSLQWREAGRRRLCWCP